MEILLTRSNAREGASIGAYSQDGTLLAKSAPIGTGYRWMHLLSAGPYGPNGEMEIVVVKTPHIGGILQYYRIGGLRLRVVHEQRGFSTHLIGSRILSMALGANFDGDGLSEILVPDQARTSLHAIKRTERGSVTMAVLPMDGPLASNVAGATTAEGHLLIAAGTSSDSLHIWYEQSDPVDP